MNTTAQEPIKIIKITVTLDNMIPNLSVRNTFKAVTKRFNIFYFTGYWDLQPKLAKYILVFYRNWNTQPAWKYNESVNYEILKLKK